MKGPAHALTIDSSRREAADTALAFINTHRVAAPRLPQLERAEGSRQAAAPPVYTDASHVTRLLRTLFN